jgi:hypothetical protein
VALRTSSNMNAARAREARQAAEATPGRPALIGRSPASTGHRGGVRGSTNPRAWACSDASRRRTAAVLSRPVCRLVQGEGGSVRHQPCATQGLLRGSRQRHPEGEFPDAMSPSRSAGTVTQPRTGPRPTGLGLAAPCGGRARIVEAAGPAERWRQGRGRCRMARSATRPATAVGPGIDRHRRRRSDTALLSVMPPGSS